MAWSRRCSWIMAGVVLVAAVSSTLVQPAHMSLASEAFGQHLVSIASRLTRRRNPYAHEPRLAGTRTQREAGRKISDNRLNLHTPPDSLSPQLGQSIFREIKRHGHTDQSRYSPAGSRQAALRTTRRDLALIEVGSRAGAGRVHRSGEGQPRHRDRR